MGQQGGQRVRRVVAIGIDGAPWELVDRFRASGSIPNIDELVRTGASGDLLSTVPAVTSPAWKCLSTGKNPGKLGAFWWTRVDFRERRLSFVSAADFRSRDYWDYVADAGELVVQINQPMTYPPPRGFPGVFVSGVPAMENDDYTSPRELKAELVARHSWRVAPEGDMEASPGRFIKGVHRLIDMRFDLAEEHMEGAGLVQVSLFFIDDVQHYTWSQMKEGKGPHRDAIEGLWAHIDRRIGRLREMAGPETHFVIFSDHGFCDLRGALYINQWLGEDYIRLKPTAGDEGPTVTERLVSLASMLHVTPVLKRMMSEERRRRLQDRTLESELARRTFFEWEGTRVYCSGEGPVYINRELVPDEGEYEALRAELRERLEAVVHPGTGEAVVERVYLREEAYQGPYVERAPDMVVVPNLGYEIAANASRGGEAFSTGRMLHNGWSGIHRKEGIVILHGPDVREGARLEGARIYDVAPTILAIKGLPIPDDMDGRVLAEAMREPDSYRDLDTVEGVAVEEGDHRYSEEEERELQKRLEALGYM